MFNRAIGAVSRFFGPAARSAAGPMVVGRRPGNSFLQRVFVTAQATHFGPYLSDRLPQGDRLYPDPDNLRKNIVSAMLLDTKEPDDRATIQRQLTGYQNPLMPVSVTFFTNRDADVKGIDGLGERYVAWRRAFLEIKPAITVAEDGQIQLGPAAGELKARLNNSLPEESEHIKAIFDWAKSSGSSSLTA